VHFVDATEQIPDWIHVVYTANPWPAAFGKSTCDGTGD
jgi:hypothetical protein